MDGASAVNYRWIEDLPPDWSQWQDSQLLAFADLWRGERERLKASGLIRAFNERLARQWAIETGPNAFKKRLPGRSPA